MREIELLSPAKNLEIGLAAINNGADAVYIGAPVFGARKAAGNSIEDIRTLVGHAHRFYCRVFVTLNTILYDHELKEAEALIRQLYEAGVDALIVQDLGILELNLPPIPLHASTQMHNYHLERIKFLDKLGFQRIVLARELSLEQIRVIRKEVKAELEVFVHGALCVSLSGQCYLSQHISGRSANRGECAQPCRMKWSVRDSDGKVLVDQKHVLSLKDLNLSEYIDTLIDAGVDSFKIEGRLKDENYVVNTTKYYSSQMDRHLITRPGVKRVGSGKVFASFEADPERSFNRGYTDYFMGQRQKGLVNMNSPKSVGKRIGVVKQAKGNKLFLDTDEAVNNGDGLCYFEDGELKGIRVNTAEGNVVCCNDVVNLRPETVLYRNYDHRFVMKLEKEKSVRKIRIDIKANGEDGYLKLAVTDEDGVTASYEPEEHFDVANRPEQMEWIRQQLMKCGESCFVCQSVEYENEVLFIPAAVINSFRRSLLDRLMENRQEKRILLPPDTWNKDVEYTDSVDWKHNVVNKNAVLFYSEHARGEIEDGFEKNTSPEGRELMCTRYCLLYEMGRCRKECNNNDLRFPLFLYNEKQQFRLDFDCGNCFMKVFSK